MSVIRFDNQFMRKNAVLPERLGNRIQKQRKIIRLTQEQLADKVGVSRVFMGYIEQGRNVPSLEVLQKIARCLGVSIGNLTD